MRCPNTQPCFRRYWYHLLELSLFFHQTICSLETRDSLNLAYLALSDSRNAEVSRSHRIYRSVFAKDTVYQFHLLLQYVDNLPDNTFILYHATTPTPSLLPPSDSSASVGNRRAKLVADQFLLPQEALKELKRGMVSMLASSMYIEHNSNTDKTSSAVKPLSAAGYNRRDGGVLPPAPSSPVKAAATSEAFETSRYELLTSPLLKSSHLNKTTTGLRESEEDDSTRWGYVKTNPNAQTERAASPKKSSPARKEDFSTASGTMSYRSADILTGFAYIAI